MYDVNDYKLCVEGSEIFLSDVMKIALVYICGYIKRNNNQPSEYETHFNHTS